MATHCSRASSAVGAADASSLSGTIAIARSRRQIEPMLMEPEQRLPGAAQFCHLVEDEVDRLLNATVRILLQTIASLYEADRRGDDKLAPPSLLVSCRKGALPEKVEFVLIEAALQSEQQPVIALPRRIDGLLVDQHSVDNAAHLDELLPVSAVAGEARDLPRRNRADLAEADLSHHAFEAGAGDAARRRATEIVINRLDLRPAELHEPLASHIAARCSRGCAAPDGPRIDAHTGSPCAPDGAARSCQSSWRA